MNKLRYDKLAEKLGPITIGIAEVSAGLGTVDDGQMAPLVERLTKLEDRKKGILAALRAMRDEERQEGVARDAAVKLASEKEIQVKTSWLEKHPPVCPTDHTASHMVKDPPPPQRAGRDYYVDFVCTNPNYLHQFSVGLSDLVVIDGEVRFRKRSKRGEPPTAEDK